MINFEFGAAENQTLDNNSIFITFYGDNFRENLAKIKNFWNRKYLNNSKHEWEVPFSCFEEIKQLYKDEKIHYLNDPPKAKKVTDSDILKGIDFNGYDLYDYQLEGVKYGLNHKNFLLLDEQGLGKTLQIISLARYKKLHQNLKHCLIICGINSLKWNWIREIEKFCKDEKGIVLGTKLNSKGKVVSISVEETKTQIDDCPSEFFWILNIEKIRLNSKDKKEQTGIVHHLNKQIEKGELGLIVIDEIHKSKNLQSSQSQGILELDNKASKVGMTGTLLVNNPLDLYCPMSFIGLINYSKWVFDNKFVIKDEWNQVLGFKNMQELHEILYKSSIRRTKDLLTLPEKIYKQEWLEFSKEELDVFQQIIGIKTPFNLEKIEYPEETMATITRMRQATVACQLLTDRVKISTKFNRLNDILEEAKINNQKVLVFCPFTQALQLGLQYCKEYNPKLVCGGMGLEVQKVVDAHEHTEGFSCLFAQEATLGVGYTLTNTEIVVFLSSPWSRATYDQCCDRLHRIGQKHTVQVIDLLISDTYDELIYKKLHGKGAMSDILIDGKESKEAFNFIKEMKLDFFKKGLTTLIESENDMI